MRISCKIEEVKKDVGNPSEGKYLSVYIATKENEYFKSISLSEYQSFYEGIILEGDNLSEGSGVTIGGDFSNSLTMDSKMGRPNFDKMMQYLSKEMGIDSEYFTDSEELTVESDFGNFVELPWEDITDKRIIVIRRAIGIDLNEINDDVNNLLFIASNSNKYFDGGSAADLREKMKDEILGVIALNSLGVASKDFKLDNIHISKHTTEESFEALPWDKYNYIHMIMHGDDKGGISLEYSNEGYYKMRATMNIDKVIKILSDKKFLLLFLSFCYSGGGCVYGCESLAFRIAKNKISKYVIGYRYGIGEESALTFTDIFYRFLLSSSAKNEKNRIEKIYKESLIEYFKNPKFNSDYMPLLYINS